MNRLLEEKRLYDRLSAGAHCRVSNLEGKLEHIRENLHDCNGILSQLCSRVNAVLLI
ncbi:hypothetical protein BKA56DRAFT_589819 [Ilyonectria sp. MPI-CAGE-AT-0026]|nr:hypothetical protein BKA56DRAFT_589819 [Ilyonectria sp. MPI-CAGE-AT-0026]